VKREARSGPRRTAGIRTVSGPTEHVVVVGAGLGGLSAALRLRAAGRTVTLLEREAVPGGRCGLLELDGYRFDTGPTVLTVPQLIADALECVGERLDDWLELRQLDPAYRAFYPDGTTLDVHTDPDAMADEVARVCGGREALGYRRYVTYLRELYRLQMRAFVDRNFDSPAAALGRDLARLTALGGFGRLAPTVARFFDDPRTQRIFSFQAMYAGLSPFDALALYAVIGYLDNVGGVWFPAGGMHAVPRALAGAAAKHGVDVRFGTRVDRIERTGARASAVITSEGERIGCDAVILNPDLPVARRDLLGIRPRPFARLRPVRYSPSCFLLPAGSTSTFSRIEHHSIHFGRAWRRTFDELVDRKRLMTDPSFLVSNPTRSDPTLAPAGRQIYSVLFPTPNLDAEIDWRRREPAYRNHVLEVLEERGYVGFGASIESGTATTPRDWSDSGLERGTPFAAAHTFAQTGPFRPANLWGENVVFTGSGTVPGVGIPMVLVSGRLAAERVVGPDPGYSTSAWD
jgi:phytoene desaturase